MPQFTRGATLLPALLLTATFAAAGTEPDPFSLEQDVSTTTLRSQALSEVPAAVTVITRREIEDHAFDTLAEALASVRGFFVTRDHNYAYAGTRGYGPLGDWGTHLLIMIDGLPMVGSVYSDAPLEREFPVDMTAVERIEITRGPGSALYGTNAVFGVVNVVTRREALSSRASVSLEGSTDRTAHSLLEVGDDRGAWTIYANASGFGGRGPDFYVSEFDNPPTSDGWARGADADRGGRLTVSAVRPNWTIKAAGSRRTREVATGAYGTMFGDDRTRTRDGWWMAQAEHVRNLGSSVTLQTRLSTTGADYSGDYLYEGEAGESPSLYQDKSRGRVAKLDVRAHFQPAQPLWTTLGASSQRHFTAHHLGWSNDPYTVVEEIDRPFWEQSVYGQVDWRPVHSASAQFGLRIDDNSNVATTVNPRVGFTWHPSRHWTARALAGRAFRAPNLYERYSEDGSSSKANPDLRPEIAWSYEASMESHLGAGLSLLLTLFRNTLSDRISLTMDPADDLLVYRNVGVLNVRGLEAEVGGHVGDGVRWRVSYALSSPDLDDVGEEEAPNFAEHVGQASVTAPLPVSGCRASLLVRAVSPRDNYRGERVPGSAVTDLAVSFRPVGGPFRFVTKVENVMDVPCPDPSGDENEVLSLPGPGRTLSLRVGFDF